jgi:hypothetical protein
VGCVRGDGGLSGAHRGRFHRRPLLVRRGRPLGERTSLGHRGLQRLLPGGNFFNLALSCAVAVRRRYRRNCLGFIVCPRSLYGVFSVLIVKVI